MHLDVYEPVSVELGMIDATESYVLILILAALALIPDHRWGAGGGGGGGKEQSLLHRFSHKGLLNQFGWSIDRTRSNVH